MKLGVSTYSLSRLIRSGEMSVLDAIAYMAEIGGEHVEIVPIGFDLMENPQLIKDIVQKADAHGLDISNYAIGANFAGKSAAARLQEIDRVKREVDIAAQLGVKRMRHDVAYAEDISIHAFMTDLPQLAEACAEIADYAAASGITTSVENHGYYIQGSDRVLALVQAVNRPNYKITVDIGNFLCADELPSAAVGKTIASASMVHVKDFYVRSADCNPGSGWFSTSSGRHLRGAIVGHGDIDIPEVLRIVKASGYDGYISLEFEGMEDDRTGTRLGFDYVRRTWEQIG